MSEESAQQNVAGYSNEAIGTPTLADIFPGASLSELERIFAGKANRGHLSEWRRGVRSVPRWAQEMAANHLETIERGIRSRRLLLGRMKKAPLDRGALNLAKWKAANPR